MFPTSDVQATLNAQATEIIAIVTATAAANATGTATVQGTYPPADGVFPTPIPGLPTVALVPGAPVVPTQPPGTPGLPGSGAAGPIDANCRYTVVAGDRLLRIVLRFNSSLSLIARVNGIVNQNMLTPGQVLRIPNCGVATEVPTASPIPTLTAEVVQPGPNVTIIVVTATPEAGGRVYIVQEGDTLYRIANRFGVKVATLAQANGITNMSLIYVGQRLVIP
jgi:LysM repeat protein